MILLGLNYLCRICHKKIGQKLEGKLQNMRMNLVAFFLVILWILMLTVTVYLSRDVHDGG
jgi:hypothetical protein